MIIFVSEAVAQRTLQGGVTEVKPHVMQALGKFPACTYTE